MIKNSVFIAIVLILCAGCSNPDAASASATESQDSTANSTETASTASADAALNSSDMTESKTSETQTSTGIFQEMQWGDYLHFTISDADGNIESFWVANEVPEEVLAPYEGDEYKGTQVTVTWREVTRFIPEAGGEETFKELVGVTPG